MTIYFLVIPYYAEWLNTEMLHYHTYSKGD